MKRAILYFILYRLLDLESILWGWKAAVTDMRLGVAEKLQQIINKK